MMKMLVMLGAFLLVALTLLSLRQHRLELTAQSAKIYGEIRDRNDILLTQQVEIARRTNPWTLANNLQKSGVNTGTALQLRPDSTPHTTPPAGTVETDLVAPLLDHAR
ncbi:MAG TPA: hypothetical protein VGN88_08200 [Phycisphaerae bacterium]